MRKTFSIIDQYGDINEQIVGVELMVSGDCIAIYDNDAGDIRRSSYLKAVHRLAPGTTICHTEEVNG